MSLVSLVKPCAPFAHVPQYLLDLPQFEFAVRTAESIAKVRNLGQNWGMCSKHCNTVYGSQALAFEGAAEQAVLLYGLLE